MVYWIRGVQVFCINEDLALWTNKNKPYGKEKPKPYAQIKVTDMVLESEESPKPNTIC